MTKKRPFGPVSSHFLVLLALCLSGTVRAADGVSVGAVFDVSGVKGSITFQQQSHGAQTTVIVALTGLEQFAGQNFEWKILSLPVISLPQSCQRLALVGNTVYDPANEIGAFGVNYTAECMRNQSRCAVGDLSGKHGKLNSTVQNATFVDDSVAVFGSRSVIGHALVIYLPGDSTACANIAFPENSTNAVTPFRNIQNMYLGNVWFRAFVLAGMSADVDQTAVFACLVTTSVNRNSNGHNWHVHVSPVGNGTVCSAAGPHYDPDGRSMVANYSTFCSPVNQSACEIGDLSGKSSPLDFNNGTSKLFYHDTDLPVEESSEGFAIVNRSVVVHEENRGAPRVACADIGALQKRQAIASFNISGLVGMIVFEQATPFDSTVVRVQLQGLRQNAESYHVHETPVGRTQTDCGVSITGGHFDPWMAGGSPTGNFTTSDDYEAGDLSGKFGQLSNLTSINATFTDPFIPLFGSHSIIGRSVVIHHPGGARCVCANVTHLQPIVTLVAAFNSSGVQGQVVFTQLKDDPLSEAAIFVEFFQAIVPSATPSASSEPSFATTGVPVTLSPVTTSPEAQPMSLSTGAVTLSDTMSSLSSPSVMLSVTSTTLEAEATSERVTLTTSLPIPTPSSTSVSVLELTSTSEDSMTFSSALTSTLLRGQPSTFSMALPSTTLREQTSLFSSALPSTSLRGQPSLSRSASSTLDETVTPSFTFSLPPQSSSVMPTLSTTFTTTSSLLSSVEPTPTPPLMGRRKREDEELSSGHAHIVSSSRSKRQSSTTVSWSIRANCNAAAPASPPECGPDNPLTCSPGDLEGKHGQLQAGGPLRRVFTDQFLPLSGEQAVEGSVLVLELGSNTVCEPIAALSEIPTMEPTTSPTTPPTTTPTAPPTATPPSPPAPTSSVFTLPVIIGLAVAGVCVVVVLVMIVVLLVCLCCCCIKKRKGKFTLWEDNEIRRNEGYHSSDIELAPIRFSPSNSPTQRYVQSYRVVFDYEPKLVDHLPLKVGETVLVLEKERSATPTSSLGDGEGGRDELWKGKVGDAVGWFPARHVQHIPLEELDLSDDEREEAIKQINIDRATEVIIAASRSFSVHKPAEVQPEKKKPHRSRSFGANVGHSINSRNSPAPSVSSVKDTKVKEVGRHRTASTSTSTPLPWITVHNVTKDKIDSTPVSLKNQQAEGKHSSFVSDDINVILDDIPQPAAAAPVISAPLAFASGDNKWQETDKSDAAITSYEYRASFAYDGENVDDLLFSEGDVINVTWAEDSGWWYGTTGTRVGWFPGSFVEPVDESVSEFNDEDDDGFLSDPPIDPPLDVAGVEIDMNMAPADNAEALEVGNIRVELQGEEKEPQRTVEPVSSSSPIPSKPEADQTGTAVGNFTAEILGLFATKDTGPTSTQDGLAREQPQAPSLEDGEQKKENQTEVAEDVTPSVKPKAPVPSPRTKVKKNTAKDKKPQRRAPPPPPGAKTSKEPSNVQQNQRTTTATTQPEGQVVQPEAAQAAKPTQQSDSQPTQQETDKPTSRKPKRKPPAVPTAKKVEEKASSSGTPPVARQEKATQPVQVNGREQTDGGKEPVKAASAPRRRAPGVPANKQKSRSRTSEGSDKARPTRPPPQLRRMRPIPPPPSAPCPPPPIKPRTKLQQKQRSSSEDQPPEPRKEAISAVAPVPVERKTKATPSISAILQSALEGDDTGMTTAAGAALSGASPPVTARQPPKKEDSIVPPPSSAAEEAKEPQQKLPKPPVKPKTKAAVAAWRRISSSSLSEQAEVGVEGVDGTTTQQTESETGGVVATGAQEGKPGKGNKPDIAPKPKPPARQSSLSLTADTSTNLTDPTGAPKATEKPQPTCLEAIAEKDKTDDARLTHPTPLPGSRESGAVGEPKAAEGNKATASSEPKKTVDVADKGRQLSQSGEKPAVPKKPDALVKAPRRQPPAPPPGSPVSVPQRRGSPFGARRPKPARPIQLPKLDRHTTAESTTNDGVAEASSPQRSPSISSRPGSGKEKPARPPPPTFSKPRNVPNTSTFFLGAAPTPVPRKNVPKPAEVPPAVEGDENDDDAELKNLKRVISPYTARNPDELTIKMGDCISELEPPNIRGFCFGMLDNGQTGLYPSDCVENW